MRETDPAALTGLVPQLLLQPLVENAIEHGVARRAGAGRIAIEVAREGDRLRVAVDVAHAAPRLRAHRGRR